MGEGEGDGVGDGVGEGVGVGLSDIVGVGCKHHCLFNRKICDVLNE